MIHLKCPARIFQLVCDLRSMAVHVERQQWCLFHAVIAQKKKKKARCKVQLQVDDKDTMLGSQIPLSPCEWRCLYIFLHT